MTVIVVYLKKIKKRISQTFYKISLALSDIFSGIVIFPNFIFELSALVWKPIDQSALSVTEEHRSFEQCNITHKAISNVGGSFLSKFSTSYINFLGFFALISIGVSISTLVIASGDRCFALYKPFLYRKAKMKMVSVILIIVVWLSCCLVGIIPTIVNDFPYSIGPSFLVAVSGNTAFFLYTTAFAVMLLAMWFLAAFAIYLVYKREKNKKNLNSNRRDSVDTERRVTRTLLLMVAVFSLNIFPTALFLIIGVVLQGVSYTGVIVFKSIQLVAVRILLCNSLANVFIYSVRQKTFYDAMINWYKDIWKCTVSRCSSIGKKKIVC